MTEPVTYDPHFLPPALARTLFTALRDQLLWERRDGAPRSEYWTNLFDMPYTYGNGVGQRTYAAQPGHALIDAIRHKLRDRNVPVLEGCFLNMYLDGTDALGWHADDDEKIDHTKPIAVVTLGEGRALRYKSVIKGSHPTEVFLEPGSLLLMHAGMQQTHKHMIPRVDDRVIGPRISLTYRGLRADG